MAATVAPQDHTSIPPLTWKLVHAEPGALVYAVPGLQPIHPPVRRALRGGWVPQGARPEPDGEGPDTHKALHYVEFLGFAAVLAAALGVGAALAGRVAVASADPTGSDSSTSTSATESETSSAEASDSADSPVSSSVVDDSEDTQTSTLADEHDEPTAETVDEDVQEAVDQESDEVVADTAVQEPLTERREEEPLTDTASAPPATAPAAMVTGLLDTLGLGPGGGPADATADSPTFHVAGGPADGTVTITPDAAFTYTSSTVDPAAAPVQVPDNFTVTVSDTNGDSTTVQVSVAPESAPSSGATLTFTGSDGTSDTVQVSVSPTDPDQAGRLVVHSSSYTAEASALTTAVGRSPQQVAVNPVLPRVYVANQVDKTVSIIDKTTGAVVATVPVGGPATAVAVTPDGTRAYVTLKSFFGRVAVIDTATNTVVATIRVGAHPTALAVSPDGTRLYVANSRSRTVSVIDTAANRAIDANRSLFSTRINVGPLPGALAVSPDGTRLYVANAGSNSVSVVDTTAHTVIDANPNIFFTSIKVGSAPSALAVTPDGSRVYVVNTGSATVSVIDADTRAVVGSLFVGCSPSSVAVSPDGGRVYVALSSDMVAAIDTATHVVSLVQIDASPEPGAHSLALDPDGQVYVVDAADQTLRPIPPVEGAVTIGRSTLFLPGTDGYDLDATWFFPHHDDPPVGLIYLQHGAWRDDISVSALAQHLADHTNSIVVTPTAPSAILARYNVANDRLARAVTALFGGERTELAASAAAAAGQAVTLPQEFVLAGHSAGGRLAAIVAGYLADAGGAGALKGVVLFDPVSDGHTSDGLAKLTGPNAVPVTMIAARPNAWNMYGDNTIEIIEAAPDRFVGVRLDGGSHIDAEGASTDAWGELGCGPSTPENAAAVQTITADWINDFLSGSRNGIYGPQGTVVTVGGATAQVLAVKG